MTKLKYVQQVNTALDAAGIECIVIRYGRLDQKIKEYNLTDHQERLQEYLCQKITSVFPTRIFV